MDPPVFRDLNCSLEDLYNGVRKRMRVTRKVVNAQGECVAKEKVIEFEMSREGWWISAAYPACSHCLGMRSSWWMWVENQSNW